MPECPGGYQPAGALVFGQEEAVAAGLPNPFLQGLPGAYRPCRQAVEKCGPLDPDDGALDRWPAAEGVEVDRVAFVPDKLAPGLERAAGLAPPAPVGAAELGDRLPGREPAPGPLQQFVALLHAGVEPIGELRRLALRADQRSMVVQHLRERRGHSLAGFLRVVLDPPDELGVTGRVEGMGPLPRRAGGMRFPVAKQCFRGIGNAEFPVDRGGVVRDLLAERRPGQPVVAAHPRIGHDLFRLARRAAGVAPPVLRVRVRVAGKTRELVPACHDRAPFGGHREVFVERCPKQRRHLAGLYGCLLQRRDALGELLASGGVEGMDIAGPRVREMRLPDVVKVRRGAVERKGAPDPGRRCRQSFADIGVQRRVPGHPDRPGNRRCCPVPPALQPGEPIRGRLGLDEPDPLLRQRPQLRAQLPGVPVRQLPRLFLPLPRFRLLSRPRFFFLATTRFLVPRPRLFCAPQLRLLPRPRFLLALPPRLFLALPLRDLVRGRQQLGRHLAGGGHGGQRADARRKVVRGHLSSPALPRPPLREQRRGAPVEPERAAELPERCAELRPRPRDAVQMHAVTIPVHRHQRALGPRRYRLCPPCGMARMVRHRLAARPSFRQKPLAPHLRNVLRRSRRQKTTITRLRKENARLRRTVKSAKTGRECVEARLAGLRSVRKTLSKKLFGMDAGLKDMMARVVMLAMHKDGLIELPPPRGPRHRRKPVVFGPDTEPPLLPAPTTLDEVRPLDLRPVVRETREGRLWNEFVARYHYLGFKTLVGAQMRYAVHDRNGWPVAMLGFSTTAWKLAPRDSFIGWTPEKREKNLPLVVDNPRFLILPWIEIPNFGSHILAIVRRRLPLDWAERYNTTPVLIETFVETPRYTGAVYRASGWIHVGTTQGRGRYDRDKLYDKPKKDVWLRPLRKNWKRALNR